MPTFIRSTSVVVLASILLVGLAGCGSQYDDKVVGVWDWTIMGVTLEVTINKDGTGAIKGPGADKNITWRIQRGNNFVFNDGRKDSGFLIDSADETTLRGTDPQAPGTPIVWTRKK